MDEDSRDLDEPPPWWRLGFDGKAFLEAVVGSVVGLIALFRPMTTSTSPTASSPFRSFLRMLNWRRDPAREMRLKQLESDIEQL